VITLCGSYYLTFHAHLYQNEKVASYMRSYNVKWLRIIAAYKYAHINSSYVYVHYIETPYSITIYNLCYHPSLLQSYVVIHFCLTIMLQLNKTFIK